MSPRRTVAEARQTRAGIVRHGVAVASVEGLEGLTIGRLAADLGMSKSGVLGHFGDKETLQLAVVELATDAFWRAVWEPVADTPAGLPRLRAVAGSWLRYVASDALPGGCFFMAVGPEFDDRPGPVRSAIAGAADRWHRELLHQARLAGHWPGEEAEQVVFELTGVLLALHAAHRLRRDPSAATRAARAVDRLLVVPDRRTAPGGPVG
ncbi:TetR/AcrR family transcriptional regulator [Dactylosporangium aurantiacum]|uniref:TetR/AcrR family transcriptional regulator n=1 Tax=Dactylosporangium aurantiacum TaxID=35754 RepID=A0A9Q9IBT8_9ACTN|nr:TetR/AcrR family transcriptional regulator [Dactylosporangium aurantiacum]MDG6104979.1 TetR/AcrR family transcriptional regulator [Dactylosporangium aurantiacum]UWZ51515.1 TetR/AcrR family transcriptional regulator [Dactylosporangium aurantiacum]